jgi:stage II sporulation protein AA (anti-sigma F factor antagonist)
MEIKYFKSSKELTVFIDGELDECSAKSAREILDKLFYENSDSKKVTFDLSGVSFMDSTGVGLLIGRYKKLKQYNIDSFISGTSVCVEKVLTLSGIYGIMPKI